MNMLPQPVNLPRLFGGWTVELFTVRSFFLVVAATTKESTIGPLVQCDLSFGVTKILSGF